MAVAFARCTSTTSKLFLRWCNLSKSRTLFLYKAFPKQHVNPPTTACVSTCCTRDRVVCTLSSPPEFSNDEIFVTPCSLLIKRRYCTSIKGRDITFEDLEALVHGGDIQLIDVREPKEIEEYGTIPNSINIPLGQVKDALLMSEDVFENKYRVAKPHQFDANIVFFGLGPIKARAALHLADKFGFNRARTYSGGWEDFTKKTGQPLKRT
ncbi:thiosulfate sulfurtransferase/rhodanese-like domain-containing protein 3 [Limulus polyphemus]|uniref:Thiosulfate sulfurtransferase/rhodanese-like domain-containing protein 3 n=1 Tax=Limulus polyphemus TaxID=6850 RepID=A0ABM1BNS2_LIMPO|nr:thiosulfate sulfurtransferase/rhodanese-like domain-containing protein 3 [Limulus polyphemus]